MTFILASRSPQRSRILERLGAPFEVIPSPFDEATVTESDPLRRALLLASGKAAAVALTHPERWVIGADTLVVASNGSLLEKPLDARDAERMLRLHSGNVSTVHTGLCLRRGGEEHADLATARVHFRPLTPEIIAWWIGTGLWRDRSGAFQAEGEGEALVLRLEGEPETVIGFPVALFRQACCSLHLEGSEKA